MPREAWHTDESYESARRGRFHIARIVEGQSGYFRSVLTWEGLGTAKAEADRRNREAGLSADDVLAIRTSSMAVSFR